MVLVLWYWCRGIGVVVLVSWIGVVGSILLGEILCSFGGVSLGYVMDYLMAIPRACVVVVINLDVWMVHKKVIWMVVPQVLPKEIRDLKLEGVLDNCDVFVCKNG